MKQKKSDETRTFAEERRVPGVKFTGRRCFRRLSAVRSEHISPDGGCQRDVNGPSRCGFRGFAKKNLPRSVATCDPHCPVRGAQTPLDTRAPRTSIRNSVALTHPVLLQKIKQCQNTCCQVARRGCAIGANFDRCSSVFKLANRS